MLRVFTNHCPFHQIYGAHSSFYFQNGQHEEGVTIIESSSSIRQGDPLGGLLFTLAHYQALLKTIVQATNYVFPSLADDTHIVGPMNKIVPTFDHLLTKLALIGFRVKVSKCKFWSPSKILLDIKIPQGYTLVIDGLHILGVLVGF
jgi:hypothetical protein